MNMEEMGTQVFNGCSFTLMTDNHMPHNFRSYKFRNAVYIRRCEEWGETVLGYVTEDGCFLNKKARQSSNRDIYVLKTFLDSLVEGGDTHIMYMVREETVYDNAMTKQELKEDKNYLERIGC